MNARLAALGTVALCLLAACGTETVSVQDAAPPTGATPTITSASTASPRPNAIPDNQRAECPTGIENGPLVNARPGPGPRPTTPATSEEALRKLLERGRYIGDETALYVVDNFERRDVDTTSEPEVDPAAIARFVGFRPDGSVFSVLKFDRDPEGGAWHLDHQSGCRNDPVARAKMERDRRQ